MATLRDELAEKTKAKIIELFGPESALAQAMEDDSFFDKLGELIEWLAGAVMLSQPRPSSPSRPSYPLTEVPWARSVAAPKEWSFTTKVTSAMSKWERR